MTRRLYLAGWQKIAWALDEDLRWARTALEGSVEFTGLPFADTVLAAWWPAIEAIGPGALRGKRVLCFADNPPAFYLTRPGFAKVANRVDLWIARSTEAFHEFQALGLPVERVPYCVDPEVFKPLENLASLRAELGVPGDAFVIGNFHRDSEGSDLSRPKVQKGADVFLEIVRELRERIPNVFVLLAGPRRHWFLRQLEASGIPHRFIGETPGAADDYERNILDRPALNRLYQALDVCVVSSRWEGGPYSVLEALLAGRAVVSTPVGIARDLLEPGAIFRTAKEAADILEAHARSRSLDALSEAGRRRAGEDNTRGVLQNRLRAIISAQPSRSVSLWAGATSALQEVIAKAKPPEWRGTRKSVQDLADQMESTQSTSCFYESESADPAALVASARGIRDALAR